MGHINDRVHKICGATLPNVVDIADSNEEFAEFVFFDTPGWQREYGEDCAYRMFYEQLIDKVDFVYVVCKSQNVKYASHYVYLSSHFSMTPRIAF